MSYPKAADGVKKPGTYITAAPPGCRTTARRSSQDTLRELRRLVQAVCRPIERAEEAAQDLAFFLDSLRDDDLPPLGDGPQGPRRPSNCGEAEMILEEAAKMGVSVALARGPDGSVMALLAGSQRLRITAPELADVLEVLCEDSGPRDDTLVGWKSISDIASRLREMTGKDVSSGAIRTALWRLKVELKKRKLNWFYVQRDRLGRFRFARRVKEPW